MTRDLLDVISPHSTLVQFCRVISVKSKSYNKHQAATAQWRNAPHILTIGQMWELLCCSMYSLWFDVWALAHGEHFCKEVFYHNLTFIVRHDTSFPANCSISAFKMNSSFSLMFQLIYCNDITAAVKGDLEMILNYLLPASSFVYSD